MKIIFYLLLAVKLSFSQTWINSGTMPDPVSGAEAVPDDSVIYVLGGYSESNNSPTDEIRIYFTGSNNWENKTTMKSKRSFFASGVYNDTIYYFGGIPGNDDDANTLEFWNKVNKGKLYDTKDIFNRTNTTGLTLGSRLYFFGGNYNVSSPNYLVEYDIPQREIKYSDSSFVGLMPAQQMCATDGHYIYLFGGVFLGISKNIYRYDPSDKSFIKLNINLLTPRAGGRAVTVDNNKIIVMGGYNETLNALQTTEVFNITNGTYTITQGPPLLTPRKDFMSVNLKGSIYVIGGVDSAGQPIKSIELLNGITAAGTNGLVDIDTHLGENYPNPFNPSTIISFSLQKRSLVRLKVYDLTGKEVTELINKELPPGNYNESFNASQYNLPSGVYFYRLLVDGYSQTRKMVLIK